MGITKTYILTPSRANRDQSTLPPGYWTGGGDKILTPRPTSGHSRARGWQLCKAHSQKGKELSPLLNAASKTSAKTLQRKHCRKPHPL